MAPEEPLGTLASLPPPTVTALFSFQVIDPTVVVAIALGFGLLILDAIMWWSVAVRFDGVRLIMGSPAAAVTRGACDEGTPHPTRHGAASAPNAPTAGPTWTPLSVCLDTVLASVQTDRVDMNRLAADIASDDPALGLRASLALHRLAERVEADHVASARTRGWSWQQIGDALGVTRQSVHAKYTKEPL